MRTFRSDYSFGVDSEDKVKPILESQCGPLTKLGHYDPMDFEGAVFVEVKTRTCKSTAYPTTLLPYSKVLFAQTAEKPVMFVFVFTDGIFWIPFSETFRTYEVRDFQREGRSDKTDTLQSYIYIPVRDLTPPPPAPAPPPQPRRP